MRIAGPLALVIALFTSGCSSSCVEVVSEEDLEPLPAEPIGPRGMPAFAPLVSEGHADAVNQCSDDDPAEHDHAAYDTSEMKQGSARKLRGKVAVLDLRIATAKGEPWSRIAIRHADEEAADARAFLLREAARYGADDLSLDIVPWFVTTDLPEVKLPVDARGRVADWSAAHAVKDRAFASVARATGVSVPRVVAALKKRGYGEVAVMLRLPTKSIAREFALWQTADGVDTAVVQQTEAHAEPGTYAHELVHLFGADDIYRLQKRDPADANDLMGGTCEGLRGARIGEATAWAIGWQSTPPARAYVTGPRPKQAIAKRR